ncbi:hypothetical protein MRX96_034941 [Rhipicephalus microplus]
MSQLIYSSLQKRGVAVLDWPPQSPVMNIIENIRGYMKAALCFHSLLGLSLNNLWSAVQDCWQEARANVQTFNDLYASLLDRMRAVIEAHGGATRF